jgi:hypothetical protein
MFTYENLNKQFINGEWPRGGAGGNINLTSLKSFT